MPGYALSAGRAERHWRDESLRRSPRCISLGLARDDVIAETMRSPKQVELRAKARGLKVPTEFIVSHRSGISLVRVENARAPVPGRSEIVRSFSEALDSLPGRKQAMTNDQNLDPNLDPNPDPANDNGGAIAPAPKASALASAALTALAATFKTVDTTSIGGRPVQPLMQFKSREGGIWVFGQRRTIPEPDSLWAVNPASFQWG